jgi:hypothetical protein
VWIAANVAAFWAGWRFGGNDVGSSGAAAAARNVWYGLVIGAGQAAALALWAWRTGAPPRARRAVLALWPLATAAGFAFGVHVKRAWLADIPVLRTAPHSLRLAVILAVTVGLAQSAVLAATRSFGPVWVALWFAADAAMWLVLEHLSDTRGWGTPRAIATAIAPAALITGAALAALAARPPGARPSRP